jgi:DNA-binding MarR family transcriptional regulator
VLYINPCTPTKEEDAMDYLQRLGLMGLNARLKRLSDDLTTDMNALYKTQGYDFESSVFPLLMLLYQEGAMSLRKAQGFLGSSHAHISQKAKALLEKRLITVTVDSSDKRSKTMALTPAGHDMIAKAAPLWRAMNDALAQIFVNLDQRMLMILETAEERISAQRFFDVVTEHLNEGKSDRGSVVSAFDTRKAA